MSEVKFSSLLPHRFKAERVELRDPVPGRPSAADPVCGEETDHYFVHKVNVTETVDGRTSTFVFEEEGHEVVLSRARMS